MSEALTSYLHDHLAGAKFALHLLEMLSERHAGEHLGVFASALQSKIGEDRGVLQAIAERVGTSGLDMKEVAAWMAEKVSELRLRSGSAGKLASFEALETLALGIQGKLALWRVLKTGVLVDVRLSGVDFDRLIDRAEEQFAAVESFRLDSGLAAFGWQSRSAA